MKTVVAASFVMKHEWSWLFLPCAMAAVEKLPMVQRKWLFGRAQFGQPAICNFCEVRIGRCAKFFDDFGKRITKIFVVTFSEAVAFHYNVAAERIFEREEFGKSGALGWSEKRAGEGVASSGKLGCDVVPTDFGGAVLHGFVHSKIEQGNSRVV